MITLLVLVLTVTAKLENNIPMTQSDVRQIGREIQMYHPMNAVNDQDYTTLMTSLLKRQMKKQQEERQRVFFDADSYARKMQEMNKEVERKRFLLIKRFSQKEENSDRASVNGLRKKAFLMSAGISPEAFDEVQRQMRKKWEAERKALRLMKKAQKENNKGILLMLRQRNVENQTKMKYHIKQADKSNNKAMRLLLKASKYNTNFLQLLRQRKAQIHDNEVKSARSFLKMQTQY